MAAHDISECFTARDILVNFDIQYHSRYFSQISINTMLLYYLGLLFDDTTSMHIKRASNAKLLVLFNAEIHTGIHRKILA